MKELSEIFLIRKKGTELFLYSIENENTGELENKFQPLEMEARLSSVLGLSDDVFNDEYDYVLQAFESIKEAECFVEYEVDSEIFDKIEIVKINFNYSIKEV